MRKALEIKQCMKTFEGDGIPVTRAFPVPGMRENDPFLLFDHFGPINYEPGGATGVPAHPHCGFEAITYMLGGDKDPDEILADVKKGIYAVSFGGGQVDITSGKFVFSCTEAYQIEDGKLGAPIKGATLIGTGPESMQRISMIGNDMKLDDGIGTCGKDGQGVPVGVGQPTLRLEGLTVGGTG